MDPERMYNPVDVLLAPFTWARRIGAALSQVLGVLSVLVAVGLGCVLWALVAKHFFAPSGSFAGLAPGPSYAIAILLFAAAQFITLRVVILGWNGARYL